jgi:hypothetical protein
VLARFPMITHHGQIERDVVRFAIELALGRTRLRAARRPCQLFRCVDRVRAVAGAAGEAEG